MFSFERRLRLLWVLLLVPILSVLGLEAPPSPLEPDEAVERAPPRPLEILRPESGEVSPGSANKRCRTDTPALTVRPVARVEAPGARRVARSREGAPSLHGRRVGHRWRARGPPPAAA